MARPISPTSGTSNLSDNSGKEVRVRALHRVASRPRSGTRPGPGSRLALLAAASSVVMASCGATTGAASTSPVERPKATAQKAVTTTRGVVPPAAGCHLGVRYLGSTAGTGELFAEFVVHNRSVQPCRLDRYPSLTLLGPRDRAIPGREERASGGVFAIEQPIAVLPGHHTGHFDLVFAPLSSNGARCSPAATLLIAQVSRSTTARVVLPTKLNKQREPINPCSGAGFAVTRIGADR